MTRTRISCCVPHCRRTRFHVSANVDVDGIAVDFAAEWICRNHWSPVPSALRKAHSQAKKAVRVSGTSDACEESSAIWRECKRVATEIAVGIG